MSEKETVKGRLDDQRGRNAESRQGLKEQGIIEWTRSKKIWRVSTKKRKTHREERDVKNFPFSTKLEDKEIVEQQRLPLPRRNKGG